MPRYQFGCQSCDATCDVIADYKTAQRLELLCVACGGVMTSKPVMKLNYLKGRTESTTGHSHEESKAQRQTKSCGHSYHCRCAVKLTKPNPFADEIKAATGEAEAD